MPTYCYPYKRGTGWRSQGFRSNPNQGANGPGGHTGYDQAMDAGTPLYSPCNGIVRNSSWVTDNYLENAWWLTRMGGDCLVIDATDPFIKADQLPTFILCHLSNSIAEVGQVVRKGQLVATSGNSGTATTGPHCHIEALPPNWDFQNGVYGRVDPELYFTEWPEDQPQGGLAAQADTVTPLPEEWYLMPNIPKDNLLQIATAVNNREFRGMIAAETAARVLATPIISTDGKKWPLSAHVQGNTARTVEALGRLAALEETVKQLAAGQGSTIDYAKVEAAAAAGSAKALADSEKLSAQVIADAAANEISKRMEN